MKTTWKFELTPGICEKKIPVGAKILHLNEQNGNVCIWALINPYADKEYRKFLTVGTGVEIPVECENNYIGTSHTFNGKNVTHTYEMINK